MMLRARDPEDAYEIHVILIRHGRRTAPRARPLPRRARCGGSARMGGAPRASAALSCYGDSVHVQDQRLVRRDRGRLAVRPVAQLGRDRRASRRPPLRIPSSPRVQPSITRPLPIVDRERLAAVS